jgi:Domain of unknown function (DUF222)/HNH endonuclease
VQVTAEVRATEIEREYRALCAGYGRLLALIATADEEQDGLLLGHGGTTSLIARHLRVTRSVASGMVNEARGLRRCPDTRAALEEGRISPRHLGQILAGVKATAHLAEGSQRAEEILLALALDQDAAAVKSAVAGIRQVLDPVGTEKEHHAKRQRSVCYLSPMLDGMWDLSGTLDPESGAMLATALDAQSTSYLTSTDTRTGTKSSSAAEIATHTSARTCTDTGINSDISNISAISSATSSATSSASLSTIPTARSAAQPAHPATSPDASYPVAAFSRLPASEPVRLTGAQRRALALTDLAARSLTAGEVGVHGGIRPHLSVLIPEAVLDASHHANCGASHSHSHQQFPSAQHESLTTATATATALTSATATTTGTTTGTGTGTGTTMVNTTAMPRTPAATAALSTATTTYGHALPPSTAQRLACDCTLTPIRIDGDGLPLNVGRTQRLATTAQRKALAVRDKGCVHSDCRIGPQWCDAHHIVSWLDGGPTDLANLVLLCRRHHTEIHYQQRLATLETPPAANSTHTCPPTRPIPVPVPVPASVTSPTLALAC